MKWTNFAWVGAGVIAASLIDLVYMFWSRSNTGGNFNKSNWHAQALGRGKYNIMPGRNTKW